MASWFVCASCCSGSRERRRSRHRYQYEVVYRREESLYSGPDYLESLPGGRSSLSHQQQQQRTPPGERRRHRHPAAEGRFPLPTPSGAESLARQNRVNYFLSSLHDRPQPLWQAFPGWRSASHLVQPGPIAPPRHTPDRSLLHARSAPLLALPKADVAPADHSPPSRDRSRDTSRDHSLASSANSSRPLLPQGRAPRPARLPLASPFRPVQQGPRSPHTPLSPGPPGYPTAIGAFHRPPGNE